MFSLSIPDFPNVSLVAFYGDKPFRLAASIAQLQTYLSESTILRHKFTSYQLGQVHGTIVGCEGLKTERGVMSKWFWEGRKKIRYIDLSGFLNYLLDSDHLPMNIRFGGYDPSIDYNYLSRDRHPYQRSFQLQPSGEQTLLAVLIGWPCWEDFISLDLDYLRRDAQKFNLLHKYHILSEQVDNDFYMRLGVIEGKLSPEAIATLEKEIGEMLRAKSFFDVTIKPENLAFARYQELSLPLETTTILPLIQATSGKLEALYSIQLEPL
ncbi:hypothetical protein IQ238_10475 [Pleurocapsales cyanobacterium LEGE 06147]|nr:hypothetical protein [Pleurocapsales cyanobacterium LEGE 06147]